jgi:hypothetical protein
LTSAGFSSRFRWGISIDNMWIYAGSETPKSILMPYLPSVRLPRGPLRVAPDVDTKSLEADVASEEGDSQEKTTELLAKELASELKDKKVDFVRCWFQWNFFEPVIKKGVEDSYRYPLDKFVTELRSNGIEIIAVLANGYSRFLPAGLSTENSKEYVDRMSCMAKAVVGHYKGYISTWQIENEPNWWDEHYATRWRSGAMWVEPGIQESILNALYSSVRGEDPNTTITVNLEADNKKTNWNFYAKYCDVIGLDFYPNYMRSSPVDASELRFCTEVRRVTGKPVYVAETGYPSGPSMFGFSEERQAAYIASACDVSFSCEEIVALSVWRYSDSYWRSFPFQENHFGLITKEGNPKVAWTEYSNQISRLR